MVVNHKLDVLCYAAKDLLLMDVVSKLLIPALVDQLHSLKNKISSSLLTEHPKVILLECHTIHESLYKQNNVHYYLIYAKSRGYVHFTIFPICILINTTHEIYVR